jgi:outer membrane protein assembly factor BamA
MRIHALTLGFAMLFAGGAISLHAQTGKSAATAVREGFPLVSVRVIGSHKFAEPDIVRATNLTVGTKVTPEDLQRAADRLGSAGVFDRVSFKFHPVANGFAVEFQVEDAQIQFIPCSFDNFVWFTDGELLSAIRERVPLYNGEVPEPGEMAEQVTSALQELLKQHGISGQVRFLTSDTDRPTEAGLFTVEDAEIVVGEVHYTGDTAIDPGAIESATKSLIGTAYRRSNITSFIDASLKPLYLERGYLAVQFGALTIKLQNSDGQVTRVAATIPVMPGPQFRAGELRWTGLNAFRPDDLSARMHWKTGAVVDAVQLRKDVDGLRQFYSTHGFLKAEIEFQLLMGVNPPIANYEFTVTEGPQYRLGSVRIEGVTDRLRDQLRDNWKLREAEPYDPTYVNRYLKENERLIGAGYKVLVEPTVDEKNKIVDVTIKFERREIVR